MSRPEFELFVSDYIAEAIEAQGLVLVTDKLALEALAGHLGAKLPENPRVTLLEPFEDPDPSDLDSILVPLHGEGPIDQVSILQCLGEALLKLRHDQERERAENPAFWSSITSIASSLGAAGATRNAAPLWIGGVLFAISIGSVLRANRWRDPTLPADVMELNSPIVVIQPQPPYYRAP
jgi:hypothetical protein